MAEWSGPEATYLALSEGRTLPSPGDPRGVEWALRYGSPEEVRFIAASYVAAYRYLIAMPQKARNALIEEMREVHRG